MRPKPSWLQIIFSAAAKTGCVDLSQTRWVFRKKQPKQPQGLGVSASAASSAPIVVAVASAPVAPKKVAGAKETFVQTQENKNTNESPRVRKPRRNAEGHADRALEDQVEDFATVQKDVLTVGASLSAKGSPETRKTRIRARAGCRAHIGSIFDRCILSLRARRCQESDL